MKLSQLRVSQIKKLDKAYYVKFPLQLCSKQSDNKGYAFILELDNENIVYGCSHYMLYDDWRIFTTLEEAIELCKNFGYKEYKVFENYNLKENNNYLTLSTNK